jgi:hypothetical protein
MRVKQRKKFASKRNSEISGRFYLRPSPIEQHRGFVLGTFRVVSVPLLNLHIVEYVNRADCILCYLCEKQWIIMANLT